MNADERKNNNVVLTDEDRAIFVMSVIRRGHFVPELCQKVLHALEHAEQRAERAEKAYESVRTDWQQHINTRIPELETHLAEAVRLLTDLFDEANGEPIHPAIDYTERQISLALLREVKEFLQSTPYDFLTRLGSDANIGGPFLVPKGSGVVKMFDDAGRMRVMEEALREGIELNQRRYDKDWPPDDIDPWREWLAKARAALEGK